MHAEGKPIYTEETMVCFRLNALPVAHARLHVVIATTALLLAAAALSPATALGEESLRGKAIGEISGTVTAGVPSSSSSSSSSSASQRAAAIRRINDSMAGMSADDPSPDFGRDDQRSLQQHAQKDRATDNNNKPAPDSIYTPSLSGQNFKNFCSRNIEKVFSVPDCPRLWTELRSERDAALAAAQNDYDEALAIATEAFEAAKASAAAALNETAEETEATFSECFAEIDTICEAPSSTPSALPSFVPSSSPSDGPSSEPSGAIVPALNSTSLPLCRRDNLTKAPLTKQDPRYFSSDAETIYSADNTFADVSDSSETMARVVALATNAIGKARAKISKKQLVNDIVIQGGLGNPTNVKKLTNLSKGLAALSLAFTLAEAFGLFGSSPSDTEIILEAIQDGFRQLNERIDELDRVIQEGLLKITVFLSNLRLDEITDTLQSYSRAYRAINYNNASAIEGIVDFEALYFEQFRNVCNCCGKRPEDIFFSLYGYACSTCDKAPKKRADFLEQFAEDADFSPNLFSAAFGDFIVGAMTQALFFYTACPPAAEASCADRENDSYWIDQLTRMKDALLEVGDTLDAVSDDLTERWAYALSSEDIKEYIENEAINKRNITLQDISNRVYDEINNRVSGYAVQVIAYQDNPLVVTGETNLLGSFKIAELNRYPGYFDIFSKTSAIPSICGPERGQQDCAAGGNEPGFKTFKRINVQDVLDKGYFSDVIDGGFDEDTKPTDVFSSEAYYEYSKLPLWKNPYITVMIRYYPVTFLFNKTAPVAGQFPYLGSGNCAGSPCPEGSFFSTFGNDKIQEDGYFIINNDAFDHPTLPSMVTTGMWGETQTTPPLINTTNTTTSPAYFPFTTFQHNGYLNLIYPLESGGMVRIYY